jgi:hypothetical protein
MTHGKLNYGQATEWIAVNDEPGHENAFDITHVSEMVTVVLVADLMEKSPLFVARDVIERRKQIYLRKK